MEHVILVDEHDREVGSMEKLEAHRKGLLHRAFSILIFNAKGEMLLQQRAESKYHSGGLWTNACCSHPRPGESIEQAAQRKLQQEMGFTCALNGLHTFIYKASLDNDLKENEFDHVLTGYFDGIPQPNHHEVQAWKFVPVNTLQEEIRMHPERFTVWFRLIMAQPQITELVG
jgi:isopentenyl-diphosphate delta-isomerase